MFVAIQFPLADIRYFLPTSGRLPAPAWPIPRADRDFVRYFGKTRRRRRGALQIGAWHDEAFFCDADRAVRFPPTTRRFRDGDLRLAFRRLFFDGYACARVEVGVVLDGFSKLTGAGTLNLLKEVLDARVKVSFPPNEFIFRPLISQGKNLARLFALASSPATSRNRVLSSLPVLSGEPVLLAEYRDHEVRTTGRHFAPVEYGSHEPRLSFNRFQVGGMPISAWLLSNNRSSKQELEICRRLRLSIFRLHAERQVFSEVLRSIINKLLKVEPRTDAGDLLEQYLNHATNALARKRFHGIRQEPLQRIVSVFDDVLGDDERNLLLLQLNDIRRQVFKKVEQITDPRQKTGENESVPFSPVDQWKDERLTMPVFDAFLSHNSQDKPIVRELANALVARGLRPWLDERELVPGRSWQEAVEEVIRSTKSAVVAFGATGFGPWEVPEMRACLCEFVNRKMPVIPVLLPGAPRQPELPLLLKEFTWVDLRNGLSEVELDRLIWGITGQKPESLM